MFQIVAVAGEVNFIKPRRRAVGAQQRKAGQRELAEVAEQIPLHPLPVFGEPAIQLHRRPLFGLALCRGDSDSHTANPARRNPAAVGRGAAGGADWDPGEPAAGQNHRPPTRPDGPAPTRCPRRSVFFQAKEIKRYSPKRGSARIGTRSPGIRELPRSGGVTLRLIFPENGSAASRSTVPSPSVSFSKNRTFSWSNGNKPGRWALVAMPRQSTQYAERLFRSLWGLVFGGGILHQPDVDRLAAKVFQRHQQRIRPFRIAGGGDFQIRNHRPIDLHLEPHRRSLVIGAVRPPAPASGPACPIVERFRQRTKPPLCTQ